MRRAIAVLAATLMLTTAHAQAGDLISIDARNTDLADVIRLIGAQSGANVVADASVKPQRITFRLHDVDAETALATLAEAYNLQTHRVGSIILVGDAATMSRRYLGEQGTTAPQTEAFALVHGQPDEVATALLSALPLGTVAVADKRSASVIVTTSATAMARARRIVAALDGPPPAGGAATNATVVALENEKPTDAVKALHSVLPDAAAVPDDRSNTVLLSGSPDTLARAGNLLAGLDQPGRQVIFEVRVTDVKPADDQSNVGVEFGGQGFGTGAIGQFAYALTKSSIVVNAQINALVQTGRAQILATPRIATINNKEASLLVGEQYPVVTVNQQTGYPSVQTIDVGVQLRLTPTIGDDGMITADLHPSYSEIIGFNSNFPIIANRKVDATLRVHDGETIVLGGLFEDTSSETVTKLPWLGDLPILGPFFRNKQTAHQRDEVVFFITPHILSPEGTTSP
jgi:type II secretory pathway component GspD/PulD (secretin)